VVDIGKIKSIQSLVSRLNSSLSLQQRLEGITSLSQDDRGVLLSASCKDSRYPSNPIFYFCESSHGLERTHTQQNFKLLLPCRIYLYNTLQLERGPLRSYEAGSLRSYVKVIILLVT
jgi:hypothetical protein